MTVKGGSTPPTNRGGDVVACISLMIRALDTEGSKKQRYEGLKRKRGKARP